MTVKYSTQMALLRNNVPKQLPLNAEFGGSCHGQFADIALASQATTDTIEIALMPKGSRFKAGQLLSDTSLGSATIAIGIAGNTGKYRAAAVFTATDTPTGFGVTAGLLARLTADEIVIITIAAAALPASGNLRVLMEYFMDS